MGFTSRWKLNEASGTRQDSQNADLDLTDNNSVSSAAGRVSGVAASFASASSQYFSRAANGAELYPQGDFTITLWFYPTGTTANATYSLISKNSGSSTNSPYFARWFYSQGGFSQHMNVTYLGSDGTIMLATFASLSAPVNQWTHLAFGYDSSTKLGYTWLNGAARVAGTFNQLTANPPATGSAPFLIGASNGTGTPGSFFEGRIEDVRFYDAFLTDSEVAHIYGEPYDFGQKYDRLVQEDLNIGTDRVWVQAPARGKLRATQIGIHTFASGQKAYEAAWTPGTLAAGGYATTTVTVPDSVTGDVVKAAHDKLLTNAVRITGHVSVDGTVKVVLHNPTASAVTIAAGTARVIAFPFGSVAGSIEADVYATWTQSAESSTVTFTANYGSLNVISIDWDYGEGAGTETDIGSPVANAYGGAGQDATYNVVLTINAVEGTFQDTFSMTTNWAAGQSGSSQ